MANTQARTILALQAYNSKKFKSIYAAAIVFESPRRTLQRRVAGTLAKDEIILYNRKLSIIEETTLVK